MLFSVGRWLLALAAVVGMVLHFTVRDSVPVVFVLFYALPLPVCAALLLGAAILGIRRPAWLIVCLLGAATVTGVWLAATYGTRPPNPGDVRVATWNLARPRHPLPALVDFVRNERPDFLALVESGTIDAAALREYEKLLPDYHCAILPGGMAVLSTSPLESPEWRSIVDGGQANIVTTTLAGVQMRILIVDLNANVFLLRDREFAAVKSLAGSSPRTLLLGDFNTPLESVHVDGLRREFINSMEAAGSGFRETWFFGLPLLSLDQIWTSRDLPPTHSRRVLTLESDHAPVIADLRIATEGL